MYWDKEAEYYAWNLQTKSSLGWLQKNKTDNLKTLSK